MALRSGDSVGRLLLWAAGGQATAWDTCCCRPAAAGYVGRVWRYLVQPAPPAMLAGRLTIGQVARSFLSRAAPPRQRRLSIRAMAAPRPRTASPEFAAQAAQAAPAFLTIEIYEDRGAKGATSV